MTRGEWLGLIASGLLGAACFATCKTPPTPVPPTPGATGGQGPGPAPVGGTAGAGGQESVGGSAGCPTIDYPDTPLPQTANRKFARRKLPPRHFRAPGRDRSILRSLAPLCSGGALPLIPTPLDQGNVGSCTGNAGVGMISAPPFLSAVHFNEPDAVLAYQGGTCVDNWCSVCTCAACPRAYCPATGANDVGSSGSSVAEWMIGKGWLRGYHAADFTDDLLAELSSGKSCVIGVDWRDSMWDVDPATGEIRVDLGTTMRGGHEMHAVLSDLPRGRVWVRNSWGAWGWCYRAQMTASSAVDGAGCGYAWLAVSNLPKLRYDGDCPVGP